MSMLLKSIKTGATPTALRLMVYGTPGIGKTTWAAAIPGALFLTCEDGGGDMDYARIEANSWRVLMDTLIEIERDGMPEGYRVLVLDTINGFAERCIEFVCGSILSKKPAMERAIPPSRKSSAALVTPWTRSGQSTASTSF